MKNKQVKTKVASKKDKNKVINSTSSGDENVSRIIRIFLVVLGIFLLVYLVTAIATGEIKFGSNNKETTPEEIQYQEIIVGETFSRSDESYYVLFMDFSSVMASSLMQFADSYSQTTDASYVYFVDMEKGFNSPYSAGDGESNLSPRVATDLKIKSPTLIKIDNKSVSQYIEGNDAIIQEFSRLLES